MRGIVLAILLAGLTPAPIAATAGDPGDAHAPPPAGSRPVPFRDLDGWNEDDHAAAFRAFRRGCAAGAVRLPALRPACRDAVALGEPDRGAVRDFFERRFRPWEVGGAGRPGFLTAYYEPELDGAIAPSAEFPVPLLARPDDLVDLPPGPSPGRERSGLPDGLTAARRTEAGLEPYPDRAAIEAGALGPAGRPLVFLRDAADAFTVHVQGSARIRLWDGTVLRVAFAGRNGHPYTSVARLLRERLDVPPAALTADRLTEWLRRNPADAPALLRQNRSFIFFRIADELSPADGPVGAAGVPLTPGRSVAADASVWPYGLPVWLESEIARSAEAAPEPLRRLGVAQDTGAAIRGPARADLFAGSGPDAGGWAGPVRSPLRFVVLWPRGDGTGHGAGDP